MKRTLFLLLAVTSLLCTPVIADLSVIQVKFLPTFRTNQGNQSNLASNTQGLQILEFTFNQLFFNFDTGATGNALRLLRSIDIFVEAALTKPALVYPNPFKLSQGAQLGYMLSKPLDVEIHIYDMFGNRIFKNIIPAGSSGGLGQPFYNKLTINTSTIGTELPSGVYYFLIINDKKVLGKGKMLVLP